MLAASADGTREFAQAARLKLTLQLGVLSAGFDLLFTDVDAPWAADLRPYVTRAAASAPYLVQLNFPNVNEHNSGVFFARSTAEVLRFFQLVVATCSSEARRLELGAFGSDQRCSNFVLHCGDPETGEVPGVECIQRFCNWKCRGRTNSCLQHAAQQEWRLNASRVATHGLSATRYFVARCRNMSLAYGLLPPALFRTGGCAPPVSSDSKLLCTASSDAWGQTPQLLVHANWAVGEGEKRAKLLAARLWTQPVPKSEAKAPKAREPQHHVDAAGAKERFDAILRANCEKLRSHTPRCREALKSADINSETWVELELRRRWSRCCRHGARWSSSL